MVDDDSGQGRGMSENRGYESDVDPDDAQALSRDEGGEPSPDAPDQHSTTGTTPNEEFVGRGSGDEAETEESGAEARARDAEPD